MSVQMASNNCTKFQKTPCIHFLRTCVDKIVSTDRAQTDRKTETADGQTDRWTGWNLYAPTPLGMGYIMFWKKNSFQRAITPPFTALQMAIGNDIPICTMYYGTHDKHLLNSIICQQYFWLVIHWPLGSLEDWAFSLLSVSISESQVSGTSTNKIYNQ